MAKKNKSKTGSLGDILKQAFEEKGEALPGNGDGPEVTYGKSKGKLVRKQYRIQKKLKEWKSEFDSKKSERSASPSMTKPAGAEATAPPKKEKNTYLQATKKPKTESRDVVIGLDFGTSSTKVIVQDMSLGVAHLVTFDLSPYNDFSYLMPTVLYLNADETFSLIEGEAKLDDLKVRLMDAPDGQILTTHSGKSITAKHLTTAYLGSVIYEIRKWFVTKFANIYQEKEIVWQLNIGLPSRSYDDDKICNLFRAVALAGWTYSVRDVQPEFDMLDDIIKRAQTIMKAEDGKEIELEEGELHPDDVNVVPEIIAEVVGYAKSTLRQNHQLHLLVDVGATTVDVATFVLHIGNNQSERDDTYEMFAAEVRRLGAYELHKERIAQVELEVEQYLDELSKKCDSVSPLPRKQNYIPDDLGDIDADFRKSVTKLVHDVITYTKETRDPNRFKHKGEEVIPVILAGGGAVIGMYKDAIANIASKKYGNASLQLVELNKYEALKTETTIDDLRRVGVAYGLSFNKEDIGKINPPHSIEDFEKKSKQREYSDNYIGKEMT